MKRVFFSLMVAAAVLLSTAVTCQNPIDPDPEEVTLTYGAYFLSTGHADLDDAELCQLNTIYATVNQNIFAQANADKKLGSYATDIHLFGKRMYVAVNGSKRISVMDKLTCQEVGSVTVRSESGETLSPRAITSYENALLVSFDEGYLASIDTAYLKAGVVIPVGNAPHDITIAGQKLYVVNSGSNTLQVLNPVTFDIMNTVTVAAGPKKLMADDGSNSLFVICDGGDGNTSLYHVDTNNDKASLVPGVTAPALMEMSSTGLIVYTKDSNDDLGGRFQLMDTGSLKITGSFISDGSFVKNPSGIFVDPNTKNVYIGENEASAGGTIYIYTAIGQYVTSFSTKSYLPCGAVFITSL